MSVYFSKTCFRDLKEQVISSYQRTKIREYPIELLNKIGKDQSSRGKFSCLTHLCTEAPEIVIEHGNSPKFMHLGAARLQKISCELKEELCEYGIKAVTAYYTNYCLRPEAPLAREFQLHALARNGEIVSLSKRIPFIKRKVHYSSQKCPDQSMLGDFIASLYADLNRMRVISSKAICSSIERLMLDSLEKTNIGELEDFTSRSLIQDILGASQDFWIETRELVSLLEILRTWDAGLYRRIELAFVKRGLNPLWHLTDSTRERLTLREFLLETHNPEAVCPTVILRQVLTAVFWNVIRISGKKYEYNLVADEIFAEATGSHPPLRIYIDDYPTISHKGWRCSSYQMINFCGQNSSLNARVQASMTRNYPQIELSNGELF